MKKCYLAILMVAILGGCGVNSTKPDEEKAVVSIVIETPADAVEALKEGNLCELSSLESV